MNAENEIPPVLPRRSLIGRLFKFAIIGLGVLIVLVVLGVVFESWRGGRAWRNYRAEWEAKGERFDVASILPKPVPDEQNFAATPFLASLFDYTGHPVQWKDPEGSDRAKAFGEVFKPVAGRKVPRRGAWEIGAFVNLDEWKDYFEANTNFPSSPASRESPVVVLGALQKFDPVLDELRAASTRPYSVFPIHYDENFNSLLPHLAVLKGVSQIVQLRAVASLAANKSAAAAQDVKFNLRLAESLKNDPLLISQLVRISILQSTLQPVWEGLARHEWIEEQLADLQASLAGVRLLDDYGRAIRGERALGNDLLDKLRTGRADAGWQDNGMPPASARFLPAGWFYHNQVSLNRLYQECALPLVDVTRHRVFPDRARAAEEPQELKKRNPYMIFSRLLYPVVTKAVAKFAHGQAVLDLAVVACALERFHLAGGNYPERLDSLVPRYLAKVPTDVITGERLTYQRTGDGRFLLYSVGWNESDEGGEAVARKSRDGTDPNQGDWVWPFPAK